MATIAELLQCQQQLTSISDSAALDVELLLSHCLQKTRSYLKAWPEAEVPEAQQQQFQELLARRVQGEPIAYLIGEAGFWTLDLQVSSATLIPRPETELLVEKSLGLFADHEQISVLDLGTGTGAIALALASEKPAWKVVGCDRESEAVKLAEHNRQSCRLNNVEIVQSNWFQSLDEQHFDLIVSNPPYIDKADPHLQQGDVRFEPLTALVADKHGMADIETIIKQAPDYLNDQGWLLFEHGYEQGEKVRQCFQTTGFDAVFTERDLAGHERVTGGCYIQHV